jgi:hypothetical protein
MSKPSRLYNELNRFRDTSNEEVITPEILELFNKPAVIDNATWEKNRKSNNQDDIQKPDELPEIIPCVDSYCSSSPKGLVILGDDKTAKQECLDFANVKLGMVDCKYIEVNGGIGKLMSPLSMKFSSDLMTHVAKLLSEGSISRVACIVRREDVDVPIVRALIHAPDGKDFVTYALARGKAMVNNRLQIDVEFYLMEPIDGAYEFFRLY